MKSFSLNQEWDLYLDEGGDIALVDEAVEVKQHIRQRLYLFRGEWFLDETIGLPWFEYVFVKPYNAVVAEGLIKAMILGTDGVSKLLNFDVAFDKATRSAYYGNIEVLTTYTTDAYQQLHISSSFAGSRG